MFSELIEQEANSGGAVGLPVSTDDVQLSPALSPFGESLSIKLSTLGTLIDRKLSKGGPASDVSFTPYGTTEATTVQSALEELTLEKASVFDIVALNSAVNSKMPLDGPANRVAFTPTGGLLATDVQAALAELDAEKASAADVGWTYSNMLAVGSGIFFENLSIPNNTNEVILFIDNVSTSVAANLVFQVYDSNSLFTTNIFSSVAHFSGSALTTAVYGTNIKGYVVLTMNGTAADAWSGRVIMRKVQNNTWQFDSLMHCNNTKLSIAGGRFSLDVNFYGFRITSGPSGNFDSGTYRLAWK